MRKIVCYLMLIIMLFAITGCEDAGKDKRSLRDELQQEAEEMIEYVDEESEDIENKDTENKDTENQDSTEVTGGSVFEEANKGDTVIYYPAMDISRKTVMDKLKSAGYCMDDSDRNRYILKTKDEELKVLLGTKSEQDVKSVSFNMPKNNTPMQDEKLRDELLTGIKTVLEEAGEQYDEKKIIKMLESVKDNQEVEEYEYSDNIIFALTRYETGRGYNIKISRKLCEEVKK